MQRKLTDINKTIIHCSDSDFGDVALIDQWHKGRGWSGCGYHYVITNGITSPGKSYSESLDGLIQEGRSLTEIGSHCKGHNRDSVGICLIGCHHFTGRQLYEALPNLLSTLLNLGLTEDEVFGHRDFTSLKTCPNIETRLLRQYLQTRGIK